MGNLLWAGQEDSDFQQSGSSLSVDTTAGRFRTTWARLDLNCMLDGSYWRALNQFSSSAFWWTARMVGWWSSFGNTFGATTARLTDAAGVVRLRLRNTSGGGATSTGPYVVEKVTAAGAATQLGSSFSIAYTTGTLFKWDWNVVYSTLGSLAIYASPSTGGSAALVYTYSGDVTTDGITALAGTDLGTTLTPGLANNAGSGWSEVIIHEDSTLLMGCARMTPTANGATDNWDVGGVANVNEATLDLTTYNASGSAGQIQQYTAQAGPSGSFGCRGLVVGGVSAQGTSGPTKNAWGLRRSGADYWGSDLAQAAFNAATYTQTAWQLDPSTGAAFNPADIFNAAGFNIGMRSAA